MPRLRSSVFIYKYVNVSQSTGYITLFRLSLTHNSTVQWVVSVHYCLSTRTGGGDGGGGNSGGDGGEGDHDIQPSTEHEHSMEA